jgi:hypothetical protein
MYIIYIYINIYIYIYIYIGMELSDVLAATSDGSHELLLRLLANAKVARCLLDILIYIRDILIYI